jgi:heme-degrading monooxygenase HmoA
MFARVTRYQIPQDRLGEVFSAFREPAEKLLEMEGHRGGFLLIDRENSTALTLTLWETEPALQASEMAASRMRSDSINAVDGDILTVDRCEVAIDTTERARVPSS